MMLDFLNPQTLEIVRSKMNGEIAVKKYCGKISIYINKTQQSGPWVEKIWSRGLKQIESAPANILVLGLGSGTIVGLINRIFPKSRITGVEIDNEMVNLGKKYLSLEQVDNLEIEVMDALEFVQKNKVHFNLIIVDLYLGDSFPEIFEQEKFINDLSQTLSKSGTVVFNRLTTKSSNFVLGKFVDKLSKYLKIDKTLKVDFNTLIYCSRTEKE